MPAPGRVNYGGVYYGSNFYGPGGYFGGPTNGYNPGRVGPGPVRDWSSGRNVPLAKPWMRPLPHDSGGPRQSFPSSRASLRRRALARASSRSDSA